jgi:hypothetical protein
VAREIREIGGGGVGQRDTAPFKFLRINAASLPAAGATGTGQGWLLEGSRDKATGQVKTSLAAVSGKRLRVYNNCEP